MVDHRQRDERASKPAPSTPTDTAEPPSRTRERVGDIEGYDAQAAALAPDDGNEGAELAKTRQDLADAKVGKPPASKPAKKASGGAKLTHGADDIVATYGTVAEADQQQSTVQVYWVDGLKTVEKGKGKKKTKKKIAEERDDVDQLPMKQQGIPVHSKLAPLFTEIFEEIKNDGHWKHILERPWAHNARQNRNAPNEWSVHSWGTAIDVNPTTNPNAPGAEGYSPTERQKIVAEHFTRRGFKWLAHSDAMHFQYHQGRTPKISDEEIEGIIADDQFAKDKDKTYPGTSRASLARDVRAKIELIRNGKLKKAEKALERLLKKTPPTNEKKLAKHEKQIAAAEQAVAAQAWWIEQYEEILVKLGELERPEAAAATAPVAKEPTPSP